MRIEKRIEFDGKTVIVYVEDDTVRATDGEDVRSLLAVLHAAEQGEVAQT